MQYTYTTNQGDIVVVEIDIENVTRELSRRALNNATGKAGVLDGLIKARVTRHAAGTQCPHCKARLTDNWRHDEHRRSWCPRCQICAKCKAQECYRCSDVKSGGRVRRDNNDIGKQRYYCNDCIALQESDSPGRFTDV